LLALKKELNIIPKKIYGEYLIWRESFFNSVLKYWSDLKEKELLEM